MVRWTLKLLVIMMVLTGVITGIMADDSDNSDENRNTTETQPEYGLSAAEIEAIAIPEYEQLDVDTDLLNDRWYMRVTGTITVYDAPNGNPIRTLDGGFNFITALRYVDGWVEINPGEWVSETHLASSNDVVSHFTGIFLPEDGLKVTPAWLLVNLYPSSEPGGEPQEANGLMYRYTLVHIYDQVEINGWRWYQIGPEQWVHQTHVAKVLPIKRPETVETEKWISVDLYEEVVIAYEGDRAIFATLTATGLPRWPTYEGTFNIYYRRVRENMTWGTPGDDFYFLEEVPWTMYFNDGRALHGAYWHDGFGFRRSHGCVNLTITDAHWLYNWVAEDFDKLNSPEIEDGPAVYVYSSGTYIE